MLSCKGRRIRSEMRRCLESKEDHHKISLVTLLCTLSIRTMSIGLIVSWLLAVTYMHYI